MCLESVVRTTKAVFVVGNGQVRLGENGSHGANAQKAAAAELNSPPGNVTKKEIKLASETGKMSSMVTIKTYSTKKGPEDVT